MYVWSLTHWMREQSTSIEHELARVHSIGIRFGVVVSSRAFNILIPGVAKR